jgi:dipeptidyl aminopeptidase/acylaminoacyl peptidase
MVRAAIALLLVVLSSPVDAAADRIDFDIFISMGRVSDPQISPDGLHVAFVVTWQDLEANAANSDLYLVPISGGEVRRLTNRSGRDNQPRFSPDGSQIAFISSRSGASQVWILPVDGGEARQVTTLSTGASNPQWAPDGRHIVFTSSVYPDCPDDDCNAKRLEETGQSKVKARVVEELLYVHWDQWRDERRSHVFIVPAGAEGEGEARDLTPVPYEVPTITLGSAHDVAVSPDGGEVCVVVNTDPNPAWSINNDLFVLPTAGGEWRRITNNDANDNHPAYSPDGRLIAYRAMSRPGFESDRYRLMVYDRASGMSRELAPEFATTFDRSVGSLVWSPDGTRIYVTANDRGFNSLYQIDAGSGRVTQLTADAYLRSVRVAPNGKTLAFLAQSATMPYEVFSSDRRGSKRRNISRINEDILAALDMSPLESFTFTGAEGALVQGWLLRPAGFDPARKYPMTFLVHGGPQGAWGDGFHWRWNYQMFASRDRVVVAVNPRGSTGFGQEFTEEISRDWGGRVYRDLMMGLDHVLDTYDFIDGTRVAAAGASYGGYMMAWFLGHTDRFDCLVNHDGVYNLESMYGATEELWFPEWEFGGPPWEGSTDYQTWSPHNYAGSFETPTLVVHGALDYRVPVTQGMELFTALQRQGVPSKFLYFPDEGHWVLKPLNAELWWKTVLDWIDQWSN